MYFAVIESPVFTGCFAIVGRQAVVQSRALIWTLAIVGSFAFVERLAIVVCLETVYLASVENVGLVV